MARRLLFALPLVALLPMLASGQNDSEYYATPKTAPEFWRATQFEVRTGSFERAAERIKGLLDLNPDNKTFFELVDKPPPGTQGGIAQFLRLRNIPRWYPVDARGSDKRNDEAKANVETLIGKISAAVEKELSNPDRIKRYANALAGSPEESTFALNELRRSGKAVPPVITALLTERLPEENRSAILAAIPLLGADTVPGFLVYLPVAESSIQIELIDALRARGDFRALALQALTDPLPTLWYLNGKPTAPELVKSKAHDAIVAAILRDPSAEKDPDLRTPQGQLTEYARKFYYGTSNLSKLPGDAAGQADHNVWVWDGKSVKEVPMTREQAVEHYGLRYARWALDIQPGYERAQRAFLGIAIEHVALRGGGGRSLAAVAPDLYAALATAPFEMLSDLLDESIRDKKTAVVLAVVRILGERTEGKASRPVGKPGAKATTPEHELRPGLLVKALDYPDPRVQFAAADAILKIPGSNGHGRNAQIVKILAATVAGNPEEGAKQKALIGDPDPIRADGLASLLERVGFNVEVVRTGRQMMRRLQDKADVDLVLVDRHIADPMLGDLLPQLRADYRARVLPVMLVASSEGVTPVNLLTALARLACVAAYEDLRDNPFLEIPEDGNKPIVDRVLQSPEEMRRLIFGRHQAQMKRIKDAVELAGFTLNQEMLDRIEYFSIQTFPLELLKAFAPRLLDQERIVLRRLISPLFREELADAPDASLKSRIRTDDLPSKEEAARIVKLMKITASYEAVLPALRIQGFQKLWDSMWDPKAPKLPPLAPVRNPEIENRLLRASAAYKKVLVVPAVFTEVGFKEQLAQATDGKSPLMSPAEKKENAKAAMGWLRKMAVGEIAGYNVTPAIASIRSALFSDDLAPLAIDALVRLPSKDAQLDLANLAVAGERPVAVRTHAAQALIEHVQTFGRFITGPQADAIVNATGATEDVGLKARLLAAQGILKSDPKATGNKLKVYVPKPIQAAKDDMAPPKEKEDPKEDPKEKQAEKKP